MKLDIERLLLTKTFLCTIIQQYTVIIPIHRKQMNRILVLRTVKNMTVGIFVDTSFQDIPSESNLIILSNSERSSTIEPRFVKRRQEKIHLNLFSQRVVCFR